MTETFLFNGCHPQEPTAGYGRVSTDKQDQSIELQRAELCRYCELKGLPPPALFIDSDTSGSIPFADREAAGALLQDCLAGNYKHLVVAKIDRLGRDAILLSSCSARRR
jgi:DNA invertase Pin-like site-specific DNA recombinase